MDAAQKFSCTLLMKQSFPPLLPNNPIKIKVTGSIGDEKLSFISVGPGKLVASQPLAEIGSVAAQRVSANAQRLEIFKTTLARLVIIVILVTIWGVCREFSDPLPLDFYLLIALGVLVFLLPFSLLLSGILASRRDVIRFHFHTPKNKKLLSIEVDPRQESGVRQALVSAGLEFAFAEDSQQEWQCERCGAAVDADATVCPVCGDKLN